VLIAGPAHKAQSNPSTLLHRRAHQTSSWAAQKHPNITFNSNLVLIRSYRHGHHRLQYQDCWRAAEIVLTRGVDLAP